MTATVTNFGDSLGLKFPKSLLKHMLFSENEDVEILLKDKNSMIITRGKEKKHLTTKERIASFCGVVDDVQFSEFDWGKPQGKEVW